MPILLIFLLTYLFLGYELIVPLESNLAVTVTLWAALLTPFVAIAWLPLAYWKQEGTRAHSREETFMLWTSYMSMAYLSFLIFFSIAREALLIGARLFGLAAGAWNGAGIIGGLAAAVTGWTSGPSLLPASVSDGYGSLAILAFATLAHIAAYRQARSTPAVTEVQVPIQGLPAALEGLKIVQISDLHVGGTIGRDFVENVVQSINRLDADIIALTGDLVDGTVSQLRDSFEPLSRLQSKLGVFYVTGNHEHYWEAQGWIQHVQSLGFKTLVNSHATVHFKENKIVLAGVLDSITNPENSDPAQALHGAPSDASVRIFLAHQPKSALRAAHLGYDLQLSGHTHGGQFLPWTLMVRWFEPFTQGLYRVGQMWLYVNRGTGYWGPPARLGSNSEITLVRLTQT